MGRFKSARQAQKFLSNHDQVATVFRPKWHRLSAASSRIARADAFSLWSDYTAELCLKKGNVRPFALCLQQADNADDWYSWRTKYARSLANSAIPSTSLNLMFPKSPETEKCHKQHAALMGSCIPCPSGTSIFRGALTSISSKRVAWGF